LLQPALEHIQTPTQRVKATLYPRAKRQERESHHSLSRQVGVEKLQNSFSPSSNIFMQYCKQKAYLDIVTFVWSVCNV